MTTLTKGEIMTDISIPIDDEAIEYLPEGLIVFRQMIEDAQNMIELPDAYNKAEILAKLDEFMNVLNESLKVAAPIMQVTYEIRQMTKDPNE